MNYFQVELVKSKVFRTREQANQHATRVLEFVPDGDWAVKIAITPLKRQK